MVHSVLKNPRNVNSARKFPSSLPQRLFAPQSPHQCSFWLTKPTSTYLQAKVLGEENDWEVDAVEVKHNLQPVKLCNVLYDKEIMGGGGPVTNCTGQTIHWTSG
jgi:hypothetical protein